MWILDRTRHNTSGMRVIGYVDRRTNRFICTAHRVPDLESRHSTWTAVYLLDPLQVGYVSTVPVICHECGTWINDESTGYAVVTIHGSHGRRRL